MSTTSFIFAAVFLTWLIYITMRGDLTKWLDVLGI